VEQATRIPDDLALVVRPDQRSVVRSALPMIIVFALSALVALYGASVTTWFGVWSIIALLCLAGAVMDLLTLRSEISFGPVLAADADHVWIRAGGYLRPVSVRLDWSEITAVTLHTGSGRRKAAGRYLMFMVPDVLGQELKGALNGSLDRHLRRLAKTFGAPLAISDKHKDTTLDAAYRELRELGPSSVKYVNT
jgi:hypothetical protein